MLLAMRIDDLALSGNTYSVICSLKTHYEMQDIIQYEVINNNIFNLFFKKTNRQTEIIDWEKERKRMCECVHARKKD